MRCRSVRPLDVLRAVAATFVLPLPTTPLHVATRTPPATATLVGRVLDHQSQKPVAAARVVLLGTSYQTGVDADGRFQKEALAAGTYVVEVRAPGYAAGSWVLPLKDGEVRSQDFELEPLAVELDPVAVERQATLAQQRAREFEVRRAAGRGYFITDDKIEQTRPRTLGDLFRTVPGVRLVCRGTSNCAVRMARTPRECKPDFVVDGFEASNSTSLDMPTVGIIGVEIYRTLSETPLQFLRTDNQCGTIVIWTQSGRR